MSIKNAERKRRAASRSQRIRITRSDQNTPKQRKKFLANGHNKQQLVISVHGEVKSVEEDALCWDHVEADTRMLLHTKYI